MENYMYATSTALRVDSPWRLRVVNLSDQLMQDTHAAPARTSIVHNSIALPTCSITETNGVPAGFGRVAAGAAKQAAPPRGIPR